MKIKLSGDEIAVAIAEYLTRQVNSDLESLEPADFWFENDDNEAIDAEGVNICIDVDPESL